MIDITVPLGPGTPVYPGDPAVEVTHLSAADGTGGFALSRLTLGTHAGTHIDPPAHLLPGAMAVDALPLDVLIGPARLLALDGAGPVTAAALRGITRRTVRLLLRTGGAPLTDEAAGLLIARGVRLVGVDALSVDPLDAPGPVHRMLLRAGVVIVEGLALTDVAPGAYTLICLPLRLTGGDGAPARAVLVQRPMRRRGRRRPAGRDSIPLSGARGVRRPRSR